MSKHLPPLESFEIDSADLKKIHRRRFLIGGLLGGLGVASYTALYYSSRVRGLRWPLRSAMAQMDKFWKACFSETRLAPERPSVHKEPRINGDIGISDDIDLNTWRLEIRQPGMTEPLRISYEDILKLPAITETFEFKCIEGWSEDTTFKGARFSDLMKTYSVGIKPAGSLSGSIHGTYEYAGLTSVDGGYYVSMDMKSLLHPQTLLCYEMNGEELSVENGWPLRLATPVKYGVKMIKQIGSITFSDTPMADYWGNNGYGDYLGH